MWRELGEKSECACPCVPHMVPAVPVAVRANHAHATGMPPPSRGKTERNALVPPPWCRQADRRRRRTERDGGRADGRAESDAHTHTRTATDDIESEKYEIRIIFLDVVCPDPSTEIVQHVAPRARRDTRAVHSGRQVHAPCALGEVTSPVPLQVHSPRPTSERSRVRREHTRTYGPHVNHA